MTVSLLEILSAARAHAAPLAAESAGYLLLAAADHVAVAPRQVTAEDIELAADGAVRLRAGRAATNVESAELGLRSLLGHALEVSRSVGPALRRAAARREPAGLPHLVRELEAALIPVNRAAARRALSRLYRETERARSSGKLGLPAQAARDQPDPLALANAPLPPANATLPSASLPMVAEASEVTASLLDDVLDASDALLTPAPPPPAVASAPPAAVVLPLVELPELTPAPPVAEAEPVVTRPEPVVERARRRGNSTPPLGTVITAQTLPGEDAELTERAPAVSSDEDEALALDREPTADDVAPDGAEPNDPEPSVLPDVVTAMIALHTGFADDEQPTRLRGVLTASEDDLPSDLASSVADESDACAESAPQSFTALDLADPPELELTPEPSSADAVTPVKAVPVELVSSERAQASGSAEVAEVAGVAEATGCAELTKAAADIEPVFEPAPLFVSELAEPAVHEALTWNPGPVRSSLTPLPPALLIAEPAPEPSPYAPAVLPVASSEVSELVDSFYVSSAAEERELRGALKEMAGLELTPMPHPLVEEA